MEPGLALMAKNQLERIPVLAEGKPRMPLHGRYRYSA
jgi:hypothetical protein